MAYQLKISKKSNKFLSSLDLKQAERIGFAIQKLAADPFPIGSLKIVGSESDYRIRIGDFRVVYQVQNTVLIIFVIKVGHRKDIYR